MPYIGLQLVGIQVVLGAMGVSGDLPLVIAFVILAAYTYQSGLRAPALIAVVKDAIIYVTVIAAVIVIPMKLGGYGKIFDAVPPRSSSYAPRAELGQYTAYPTMALGSALALFLYPHSMTGVLSSSSRDVIRRNTAMLPAYSFLLALIAALGYMALAAGVGKNPAYAAGFAKYGANFAVPALFLDSFPPWFVGFSFAAIAIGALVPAAIMSIAAANLFTRNVYREYIRPTCSGQEESTVAKVASLVVKFGALAFIVLCRRSTRSSSSSWAASGSCRRSRPSSSASTRGGRTAGRCSRAGPPAWASARSWPTSSTSRPPVYPLHLGPVTIPGYAALLGAPREPRRRRRSPPSRSTRPEPRGARTSRGRKTTAPRDLREGAEAPREVQERTQGALGRRRGTEHVAEQKGVIARVVPRVRTALEVRERAVDERHGEDRARARRTPPRSDRCPSAANCSAIHRWSSPRTLTPKSSAPTTPS